MLNERRLPDKISTLLSTLGDADSAADAMLRCHDHNDEISRYFLSAVFSANLNNLFTVE